MATTCSPAPTLTTTVLERSSSWSTTTTTSLSTAPNRFSYTTLACASGSTCVHTMSIVTIPGDTAVVTIPIAVPVYALVTKATTLFDTVCPTSIPPSISSPTSPTTTSPPQETDPPTNGTSSFTSSTNPNSVVIPSSSQPQGPSSTLQTLSSTDEKSNTIGPIIGAIVGGLAVLFVLGLFTLRFIKKQRRFNRLFNEKDNVTPFRRNPLESDFNTTYNYNPIQQQNPPSGPITPPSSPPLGGAGTSGNGNNTAGSIRPSVAPLLVSMDGTPALDRAASAVWSSASSYHNGGGASGPSTASSHQALLAQTPISPNTMQPQGYFRPQLQQQSIGRASSSQAPGHHPPQSPLLEAQWSPTTMHSSVPTSMAQAGYPSGLGWSPYASSAEQPNSPSAGHWYDTTTTGMSPWGVLPSPTTTNAAHTGFGGLAQQPQQPQSPMFYNTQYVGPFAPRAGSPVSIQEQRGTLQVVNTALSASSRSESAPKPQSPSAQVHPTSYHVTNLSAAEQESVGVATPTASSSSAQVQVQRDGKGRPIRNEKSAPAHLNGALYEDPEDPSGPAPPAYQR